MAVSNPINPIAAHVGSGVLQIKVENQVGVARYELMFSDELNGTYYEFSNNSFTGNDGFVYGFPIGLSVFAKIRAIGEDETESDWVQVKRAQYSNPQVNMIVTGIVGTVIPAGSVFTCQKNKERLYGFRFLDEVTIQ
jgi:hypothetical protein